MGLIDIVRDVDPLRPTADQTVNILNRIQATPSVAKYSFDSQRLIAKVACLIVQETEGLSEDHWEHTVTYHKEAIAFVESIGPEEDLGNEEIHIARKHIELYTNLAELLYQRHVRNNGHTDLGQALNAVIEADRFSIHENKYYGRVIEIKGRIEARIALEFSAFEYFEHADNSFDRAIGIYEEHAGDCTIASTWIIKGRNALHAFRLTTNSDWKSVFHGSMKYANKIANARQKDYIRELQKKMNESSGSKKYNYR